MQKAVERIPSRDMEMETDSLREIMDSALGERLEQLRGVDREAREKPSRRGKKISVAPGRSFTEIIEEEGVEEEGLETASGAEEDLEEVLAPPIARKSQPSQSSRCTKRQTKKKVINFYTASSDEEEEQEPQPVSEDLDYIPEAGLDAIYQEDEMGTSLEAAEATEVYPVGSFVAAVYDKIWYIAQVIVFELPTYLPT